MSVIVSCLDIDDLLGIPDELSGNFWAQNAVNGTFYRVNADKLYEGSK